MGKKGGRGKKSDGENEQAGKLVVYVKDLGSKNGTKINGMRIETGKWFKFESGDVLKAGQSEFLLN